MKNFKRKGREKERDVQNERRRDERCAPSLLYRFFFNRLFNRGLYSRYVYLPAHHGIPIKDGLHSPTRAMTNLSLGSWQREAVNVYGSLLTLASRWQWEEHLIILDAKDRQKFNRHWLGFSKSYKDSASRATYDIIQYMWSRVFQ